MTTTSLDLTGIRPTLEQLTDEGREKVVATLQEEVDEQARHGHHIGVGVLSGEDPEGEITIALGCLIPSCDGVMLAAFLTDSGECFTADYAGPFKGNERCPATPS